MKNIRPTSLSGLAVLLVLVLGLGINATHAEDIDIFVGSPPAEGSLPNVLFIIDNTGNWSTPFVNEKAALVATFNGLPVNDDGSAKFNVGVMFSGETSSSDNNTEGGYVRAAMRPMTAANKAIYATMIADLHVNRDKGNAGVSSLVMAEAYRYFTGGEAYAGNNKAKADYTGNTAADWSPSVSDPDSKAAMQVVYALPGNALSSKGATLYNPPDGDGCAKNFIINISNGPAQDFAPAKNKANEFLAAAGGSTALIPLSPAGSQDNPSDEWARFMKQSPLGVTTYTIDVNPKGTGQGPGWTEVLQSMATVSEGKYRAVNSETDGGAEIADAVNQALAEILSVNSVFASVSLPVSVNTQGTYLNQVFIGMFRPDGDAEPRWNGNLKQYKLGVSGTALQLQDATGASAINNQTGFIGECARSFWTPAGVDTYWTFKPQGTCPPPSGNPDPNYYANSNSPDGSVVEKGAQAYVLRQSTARNIKTCSKTFASCTTLTDFATGNSDVDEATLGVPSAERNALIQWARGLDVLDEDNDEITTAEMRPSVHGDVVHSRPVALNLGTDANPKVTVFYGGNDGVFRAVNGNRTASIGSVPAGGELWSFVPPESFPMLKRLRDNAPLIKFPNVTDPTAKVKDYGMDGAVTAHQFSTGAWIYSTMRRGGRALYAFNVNDADPSAVTLKWKKGCPNNLVAGTSADDASCSSGFGGMGQTWATPKVVQAEGYPAGPLLMMGGGYDPCEDADPHTCTSGAKGRHIYVMDADSGALLKTFDTTRPVIADVTLVPDLATGLIKHVYAVDLGGDVYRIDVGDAAPADWTMTKIAALGCSTPASCTGNRKFMFAPDVIADGEGYSLLVGSGDREKPLIYSGSSVVNSIANYFFKITDKPGVDTWLTDESANCGSAVICLSSLQAITTSATPSETDLAAKKGFYLGLATKEQVVTSAITIFGTVSFSTYEPHVPDPNACSNELGIARVYNIDVNNAGSLNGTNNRFEVLPPVGLPPSPTAGIVQLDDGTTRAYCIGCSGVSPLEAVEPPIPPTSTPTIPKSRVYWYTEQ